MLVPLSYAPLVRRRAYRPAGPGSSGNPVVLVAGLRYTGPVNRFLPQRMRGLPHAVWVLVAGTLMGIKTVLNELIAYLELAKLPADALFVLIGADSVGRQIAGELQR